jgi:hypothetical protein
VTVDLSSSRDHKPEEADELVRSLRVLLDEWRDRDLDEMLHNFADTTPENLAPWIMERLLATSPRLASVEVSDGVISARVEREPSGLPSFIR